MPELEQQGEANSWLPAGSEHITISYLEQPSIIPALGAPVLSEWSLQGKEKRIQNELEKDKHYSRQ